EVLGEGDGLDGLGVFVVAPLVHQVVDLRVLVVDQGDGVVVRVVPNVLYVGERRGGDGRPRGGPGDLLGPLLVEDRLPAGAGDVDLQLGLAPAHVLEE